ncbi:MAG TPA: FAD-dependent oxidoreductase [Steroidobacteraceae bacterium]|nr:FAD-dependent oxidoreductase [Steroidobacteraceae bacterium]
MSSEDRRLGMGRAITRRDFVHGLGLTGLGLSLPWPAFGISPPDSGYYPPALTGLRGSHAGSFEVAHALAREHRRFENPRALDERYDLVVVGAGISGLASAYYYRKLHGAGARILLLDNHDDFGGHAKRNEFSQGGPMRLAWGGTVNMEYTLYDDVARGFLDEFGIDIPRLLKGFEFDWLGTNGDLKPATFFDAGRYGRDVLLPGVRLEGMPAKELARHVAAFPISADGRAKLEAFLLAEDDVLAGLGEAERHALLRGTSYTAFMRERFGLPEDVLQVFSNGPAGFWGVPAGSLSVSESLQAGAPGAHRLGGTHDPDSGERESPAAMFPDGNSSIARLVVRSLIPAFAPRMRKDADPFDIVTTPVDYAQLDRAGSPVRLRLSSTAVRVGNRDGGVAVDYVRDGDLFRVTAKHAVLACYNAMIPYLAPELPEAQKAALAKCVKRPMLVVNTLLKDGRALKELGIKGAQLPGSFLQNQFLVTGINVGDYQPAWKPEDPCVMQGFAAFSDPAAEDAGLAAQARAGRGRLLGMAFEDFEREVRRILDGMLRPGGLDAARDILAITVNRWPHGYARDHLDLEDADWNMDPPPETVGRQRFGNVAIANSDAGADAYTHAAIDQAWRAVNDLG